MEATLSLEPSDGLSTDSHADTTLCQGNQPVRLFQVGEGRHISDAELIAMSPMEMLRYLLRCAESARDASNVQERDSWLHAQAHAHVIYGQH